MRIEDGILDTAHQRPSPNKSGKIKPTKIVVHYTGGIDGDNAVRWLCNPKAKASAHFVIDVHGGITQLVATNRKAWHAGRSKWQGRTGVNRFTIGIELVNAGLLRTSPGGPFVTRGRGDQIPARDVAESGGKHWHKYAAPQIRALILLICALKEEYAAIDELVGHSDVAPKRKIDPGPAFPWDHVASKTATAFCGKPAPSSGTALALLPPKPPGMPLRVYETLAQLWFWYQSKDEGDESRQGMS